MPATSQGRSERRRHERSRIQAQVDERGCRRDIRSNGWIEFRRGRPSQNRSGRRNRDFFVRCGTRLVPQFHRRQCRLKSGPDVFADPLVPAACAVRAPATIFPFPVLVRRQASRPRVACARVPGCTPFGGSLAVTPPLRSISRLTARRVGGHARAIVRHGYRCPKHHGKPAFTNTQKCLRHRHFCDSAQRLRRRRFTSRSSRYLNRSSNLMGHDHPHKPANGERITGRLNSGRGPRSGEGGQQQKGE